MAEILLSKKEVDFERGRGEDKSIIQVRDVNLKHQ